MDTAIPVNGKPSDDLGQDLLNSIWKQEDFITRKALSKETGINEQQLSHYANGWRMPKPATQAKIINGIHSIARELSAIS